MSLAATTLGTRLGRAWSPLLREAPLGPATFADVLADQVRFRTVRSGATSARDVRPDSHAAARLWQQPQTRRFVQGVLDLANEVTASGARGGGTPLRGFTLATSNAGYLANRSVHHFRTPEASRIAYEAALDASREHLVATAAVRKGAWLHLGPDRSAGLLAALRAPGTPLEQMQPELAESLGRGVKTLLHELNHVGSPKPLGADDVSWLSEGTAETLARWPGRVEHAGTRLGLEVPTGVGTWFDRESKPYQNEVDAVRGLLHLTGIDARRASDFARAEHLLNATPEDELPAVLGRAIAERHSAAPASIDRLADTVARTIARDVAPDGRHADPTVVGHIAAAVGA